MKFKDKLLEGVLVQRYKRFFADVEYQGGVITIHVPNTGSLRGVIEKSQKQKCWFSLHGDESKKLKGTLEAVQTVDGVWVGLNTASPNKLVKEVIEKSQLENKPYFSHWSGYKYYRPEYKISAESRLDGVFCSDESDLNFPDKSKHFIEIKNTTLVGSRDGRVTAMFPDAVTERGQKHLKDLMRLMAEGHTAELIFTIQRSDPVAFCAAAEIDPEYARLLAEAIKKGLRVTPVLVEINQSEVFLTQRVLEVLEN